MREVIKLEDAVLIEILKLIAPGTILREGLDNILKAKTGALIVIGDSKEIMDLVDGGFYINENYTASRLYELAKMDGAIVLSKDVKKILYANAQLIPSSHISTQETGTRHRTSERVAKQTGEIVVSISQRRNVITIFKGNFRYILQDTAKVITKTNQALQTLEKYKSVFDSKIISLNEYEFDDTVTLDNVITAIQRAEMVMRIANEIRRGIYELGEDGRLVEMQLEELVGNTEAEETLIIKDYITSSRKGNIERILEKIINLEYDKLMDKSIISHILGYKVTENFEDIGLYTKGYRILSKIPKMPVNIVQNLVKSFKSFQHVVAATTEQLDDVEGIGEVRAKNIKQSLRRMQEQFFFDTTVIK